MEKAMNQTVDHLNSFLRGELAAVETYRLALNKLDRSPHRALLEHCERSHSARARLLEEEVRARGGEPSDGSGPWGTFAKLIEGSASLLGEKAAISALEEGEDHGRDDYRRDLKDLEPSARHRIESDVIPEQNRTHQAISSLKKSMAS
jgi:demethoxyubiquinone hydroxylase (CLK1/Coq7/Cat5 family)